MEEIHLTKQEARRFLLHKQGLLGDHRFVGKDGVLGFIRQAGCIQFDPIDICGKSPELLLHSRVKGFSKRMLRELLYTDRKLVDYFDKNLAIIPAEHWKYFERERRRHRDWERSHGEIRQVHDKIMDAISERGPLCSADLEMTEKVDWYWSAAKLSRAALEHMYFTGELAVHHKAGTIKYYDLIRNCLPAEALDEPDPFPLDHDHRKWRVLQRIGSVGLLWNRASDAWLGIPGLNAAERNAVFSELLSEGRIAAVQAGDIRHRLYCLTEDLARIPQIQGALPAKGRCEFLAPLDNMMWDRNLVKALFDFEYKWEIYTPKSERKYGYYVLPILYGEQLIGRIEPMYDKKAGKLNVANIWYEPGVKPSKGMEKSINAALKRLEAFCCS